MLQTRLRFSLIGSVALLLTAWAPRAAWAADECQTSADCGKGLECTVFGSGSCPGAPACAPGSDCPAPAPCEITEEKACTPAHCTTDAQCGDGWVCHAWETSSCATSDCACPSDQPKCDCAPAEDTCAPETESYCTPKYLVPCQAASDCGEGFDCVEQITTTCTGSGGSASSGSGNASSGDAAKPAPPAGGAAPLPEPEPDPAPAPVPPSCTSEPSGVFHCVARELACEQASDCPAGWQCEQQGATDLPACAGDGCPAAEPAPPAPRLCRPEYGSSGGGKGYDESASPTNPGGPVLAGNDPGSAEDDASDADGSRESSACQMGHAPASRSTFSLGVALGALLALKRRRR